MGYRSDVVIAVTKKAYVRAALLEASIPPALSDGVETLTTDTAMYWRISGWKWYDSYAEIREIEAWFGRLADLEHEDFIEAQRSSPPTEPGIAPSFGAMRMGENDDDIQTWGDPYHFDICLSRHIHAPI